MIAGAALLLLQAQPVAPEKPRAPPAAPVPAPGAPAAASAPKPPAAPALKPLDAAAAVDTFKAICWANLRDPDAVRAAVPAATIPLAEVARARPGPTQTWRSEEAILSYTAGDDLPAGVPSRQCTLRTRLPGAADQLTLAARVATALGLSGGATRTSPTGAQTTWDVRQPDGRVFRLIVATANATGGQTDLRQLALLLAPK